MPSPGSPTTIAKPGLSVAVTRFQADISRPSSAARPTKLVSAPLRTGDSCAPTATQTGTGSALPLAVIGSASSNAIAARQARYVRSSTSTPLTGAADWSRAAVFRTSPQAIPWPSPIFASSETIASPVVMPTRTRSSRDGSSSFRASIAAMIARPARTARSGSSSWATGAPKSATTASPMNFSTLPPCCSRTCRSRA